MHTSRKEKKHKENFRNEIVKKVDQWNYHIHAKLNLRNSSSSLLMPHRKSVTSASLRLHKRKIKFIIVQLHTTESSLTSCFSKRKQNSKNKKMDSKNVQISQLFSVKVLFVKHMHKGEIFLLNCDDASAGVLQDTLVLLSTLMV